MGRENKNKSNIEKQKISFQQATKVFEDSKHKTTKSNQNGENRWKAVGKIYDMLYSVVYTLREKIIKRIISARKSNKQERQDYLNQ